MAKVISTAWIETDYEKPRDEWLANENSEIEKIAKRAKRLSKSKDPIIGKEIKFPIADGYARYIVADVKPLLLIHLGIGDAYRIPVAHARGLNLADVRNHIEADKKLSAMFS